MEPVRPSQLVVSARVADALVYAVGIAGVVAGGLLLRRGEMGFAIVAWSLTFVAGAGLRLAAWLARGVAELLARQSRMEDDLAALRRADLDSPPGPAEGPPDPYRRWGPGWH
ncbi:MAG: hypothetical protein H0V19_06300 [Euzebyales bacterium]|nr:hypothetical protein [Euzebyales bacterium]